MSFKFPLEKDLEDWPLMERAEVGGTGGVGDEGRRIGSVSIAVAWTTSNGVSWGALSGTIVGDSMLGGAMGGMSSSLCVEDMRVER